MVGSIDNHRDAEKARADYGGNAATNTMRPTRIANPAPAGLFSFASTTFLLSMYNVFTRGIHTPNVVVGMALFAGGLLQLLAGMWEFPRGHVFGATAFSSYGAFWMSYATIFIPGSGIQQAYASSSELNNAVGMYLIVWFMITTLLIIPVLRRNIAFVCLLTCLGLAYLLLGIASFKNGSDASVKVQKAGGVFGILAALAAWYIGVSDLLTAERSAIMRVPLGVMSEP